MSIEQEIEAVFDQAGATGWFHAIDLATGREVALGADEPVVTASVFKVPVLLAVMQRIAEGQAAATDRIRVPADRRTLGPTGISVMLDDVDLSLRDMALLMMCVSDNTATDVLMEWLGGAEPINDMVARHGLKHTVLVGDCDVLLSALRADLGAKAGDDTPLVLTDIDPALFEACRSLRPSETNRSTAREMTALLGMIWNDEAGPAEACAECRRIMGVQVWPHRLSAGFGDGIAVSGKTGTLPGIRNEVGVVEYPDGGRYAVAVFTKARSYASKQPPVDASIGATARLAVDHLRSAG